MLHDLKMEGGFPLCSLFHGSPLYGDKCTAGREVHTNFAEESACQTADNVRNEDSTIRTLQ
jgi:hypothetical protein